MPQYKKQERPLSSLLKAAFFIGLSSYKELKINKIDKFF